MSEGKKSKPVIVTNRPILKDPMVVDDKVEQPTKKTNLRHTAESTVQPLSPPEATDSKPAEIPAPESKTEAPAPAESKKDLPKSKEKLDAESAERAKNEAAIQHLIDSKKYALPINAAEQRKTKRFVVLGIFLAVLLVLVWGDIAADAGIIHVGVKPATHFFSN